MSFQNVRVLFPLRFLPPCSPFHPLAPTEFKDFEPQLFIFLGQAKYNWTVSFVFWWCCFFATWFSEAVSGRHLQKRCCRPVTTVKIKEELAFLKRVPLRFNLRHHPICFCVIGLFFCSRLDLSPPSRASAVIS